ncbi:sodium:solute symporter family protein [Chitinophaga sp. sic0106]|uniref:sodium:solute symporter family protein n=1 Tax=Chitinophaga sp. sic0106 TaxID=2854785 RepID=UPI001C46FEE4|nr:sodium:solute symporter family protein [Chitinophaga sp. sic0106]MBV7532918.1 Na+:solute symporter [Chitinophaga sp. sic0106]
MLQLIDWVIIGVYLGIIVLIGLLLRRKAKQNKTAYMLGGKSLPWYMLGLSNAADMFDISGTMWLVTLTFVYGMKSIWIPWLWPIFNQVFMMVFVSAWLRRSNVSTGAEWIITRFGNGRDAALSHTITVVFALISCLGFMAYGFVGLGKFMEIFIPWQNIAPYVPFTVQPEYVPHLYGVAFALFAVFYSILGGMSSIVWADAVQYVIRTAAAVIIAVIAMRALAVHTLNVPEGWFNPFFGWKLDMDWGRIIPEVNDKINSDGYTMFGAFFMMMVFKGLLVSLAGPAPNYDMQKILSTRSPQEAAKMSGFVSIVLMPVRYLMIIGFAVLGLIYYKQLNLKTGDHIDFEKILPAAISSFAPVGVMGLLVAGMLASFIGTFAGTLNAAQAYILNDVYLRYINPAASNRKISSVNYLSGILVVVISILIGVFAKDVNSVLQWLVSGLWGGYVAANVLKWYWWRFNGYGFFWGMLAGIAAALICPYIFTGLDLYYFPVILLISLAGCIIGTLATPPADEKVLEQFYYNVRPWGFWKPVLRRMQQENPALQPNRNFGRDMFNVATGIVAQLCLMALPMYLILQQQVPMYISAAILVVTLILLKKFWWNSLEKNDV